MKRWGNRAALAAVLVAGAAATAPAASAHGGGGGKLVGSVTENGAQTVIVYRANKPWKVERLQVAGLTAGDRISGLDVRPATRTLYGKGQGAGTAQNYIVQLNFDDRPAGFDGRAIFSPIGARYATTGASFGYDFNPTVDRIRVISDADQNRRVNPDTGAALVDGTIRYAAGDRNFGRDPSATGAGYIPAPFGGMTTLYDVETNQDVLTTQTPANDGTLQTIGSLGVKVTNVVGFDIASGDHGRNVAYAALQREGESRSGLYTIDLRSGRAYRAGHIGSSQLVETLAILRPGKHGGWSHGNGHKHGRR